MLVSVRKKVSKFLGQKKEHMRPSFIIIGAQKCGTTALFEYMSKHPDILPDVVGF